MTASDTTHTAKLTAQWRRVFLTALAETSNVAASCAIAGVTASRAYKLRRIEPDFARRWRIALLEGYEHLEMEVLHRLRFGAPKDEEVKFDTAAALRLLVLHRETVARERVVREEETVESAMRLFAIKAADLRRKVEARHPELIEARLRDMGDAGRETCGA